MKLKYFVCREGIEEDITPLICHGFSLQIEVFGNTVKPAILVEQIKQGKESITLS